MSRSGGVFDDGDGAISGVRPAHEVFAQLFQAADRHQKDSRFLRMVIADVRAGVVLPVPRAQGHLLGGTRDGRTVRVVHTVDFTSVWLSLDVSGRRRV